ncbi:hypothetical protein P7K49_001851, partial [Saguinus oedipus]
PSLAAEAREGNPRGAECRRGSSQFREDIGVCLSPGAALPGTPGPGRREVLGAPG